jgi:hypothetical protein
MDCSTVFQSIWEYYESILKYLGVFQSITCNCFMNEQGGLQHLALGRQITTTPTKQPLHF